MRLFALVVACSIFLAGPSAQALGIPPEILKAEERFRAHARCYTYADAARSILATQQHFSKAAKTGREILRLVRDLQPKVVNKQRLELFIWAQKNGTSDIFIGMEMQKGVRDALAKMSGSKDAERTNQARELYRSENCRLLL